MIKKYTHYCKGTCSREIDLEYDDATNRIIDVQIVGGCNGNLKGIRRLIIGMNIDDVIAKLKGIKCGPRSTSCPDQIALALEEAKKLN